MRLQQQMTLQDLNEALQNLTFVFKDVRWFGCLTKLGSPVILPEPARQKAPKNSSYHDIDYGMFSNWIPSLTFTIQDECLGI